MPDARGAIAVRPTNGLCNRLRVISSFNVLARSTGRELRVCWAPGKGFSDEDVSELFENHFVQIDESEFERFCGQALCLHEAISISGVPGSSGREWRWDPTVSMDDILDPARRPDLAYWGCQRLDTLVGPGARMQLPHRFKEAVRSETRAWRPVESLRQRVDELAVGFDATTVGVHVRRGDALAHPRIGDQFRRSSDTAFFARMDRLLRRDSTITFFLATDSAEAEERFRDRYGDAIRSDRTKRFVDSIRGQSKANQADAVVDLYTLARTRRVLGTNYSSFSETAATIGGIPLETMYERSRPELIRYKLALAARKLRRLKPTWKSGQGGTRVR